MIPASKRPLALVVCAFLAAAPDLSAASPALGGVAPRGGQRGKELVLVLSGARLADAQELLLYSPGITVEKLEAVNDGQVKATVKIAPDCRLGEHALRVRAASGISELATFYVGALPETAEKEPNGDFAAPHPVELNTTITGVVQNEDVDYFSFQAKKGQRISAEVEGMRLGSAVFDPSIALLSPARFELASADDTALLWQDAAVTVVIPEDGVYRVQVRESAYGGNDGSNYRLHLGTFPRPFAALPAGGKLGEEIEVLFPGCPPFEGAAATVRQKFKLPAEPVPGFGLFAEDAGGIAPSPVAFRLSTVGNALEAEPNNDHQHATPLELPLAANGAIGEPGDVDFFRFKAKKGETFDVHLYARRIRSPLDPVMTIYHFGGGGIVGNDDAVGPDSYFRFTAPEDKEYAISVSDHLGKGGPHYVYRIEFTPVEPRLTITIPKVAPYSQERLTVPVPRGNRYAALIQASRSDFGGELVFGAEKLPAGITFAAENMAANVDSLPVVFEAAPDAPVAGTLTHLSARHADPAQKIRGGFSQSVDLLVGSPNQSVYWRYEADRAAVAVTEEVPFQIQIVEPKVPLVQAGSMSLRVTAARQGDFKAPIAVQMLWNPPGIGSAGGVTIPEGQNEAAIPLNASGDAPARAWKIAVTASATVKNGPIWVASQLATLQIAPPYVAFAMEKASVEQGKETEIYAKVEPRVPFEGKARVTLLGLPAKVTTPELEIGKDSKEIAFKVKVDPQSPAGLHKNLFCQVVVVEKGEPIVHSVGSTELRIDVPLPPKPNAPPPAAAAAAAPAAAPAEKPPEKRLTRLEKLRLEHTEKQKAQKK